MTLKPMRGQIVRLRRLLTDRTRVASLAVLLATPLLVYRLILTPNLAFTWDLNFPIDPSQRFWSLFYAWDPMTQGGVDQFTTPGLPFYGLIAIVASVLSAGTVEKLVLVSTLALAGWGIYFLTRKVGSSNHAGSLLAGIAYQLNPWVLDRMSLGQFSLVQGYAFFPLFLVSYIVTLKHYSKSRAFVAGIFLLSLIVLDIHFAYIAVASTILVPLLLFATSLQKGVKPALQKVTQWAKASLLTVGVASAFALYAIVPEIFTAFSGGFPFYSSLLFKEYALRYPCPVTDIIRLRCTKPFSSTALLQNQIHIGAVFTLLTFVPVATCVTALLVDRRKSTRLVAVGGVSMLAIGGYPSVPLPESLFDAVLSIPGFSLIFRDQSKFIALAALSQAYLISVLVSYVSTRRRGPASQVDSKEARPKWFRLQRIKLPKTAIVGSSFLILLLLGVFANSWPMLTGNLGGTLQDTQFPPEYYSVYNWLRNQNGDFSVLLIPSYSGAVTWQSKASAPIPPLVPTFLGTSPAKSTISLYDVSSPLNSYRILSVLQHLIEDNRTLHFADLLSVLNVKYVIIRTDVTHWLSPEAYRDNAMRAPFLKLALHLGSIWVFENLKFLDSRMYASSKLSLVVGSRDFSFTASDISQSASGTSPEVYADQLGKEDLNRILPMSTVLAFHRSDFIDLVMLELGSTHIASIAKYADNSLNSSRGWIAATTSDTAFRLNGGDPAATSLLERIYQRGDYFSPDGIAVVSGANSILDFSQSTGILGPQEVWIRMMSGQDGGRLALQVGSSELGILQTASNSSTSLRWIKLGTADVQESPFRVEINDIQGQWAVDKIAIVPVQTMNALNASTLQALTSIGMPILYSMDAADTFSSSPGNWIIYSDNSATSGFALESSPSSGVYLQNINGNLNVTIQNLLGRTLQFGVDIFINQRAFYTDFNFGILKPYETITRQYAIPSAQIGDNITAIGIETDGQNNDLKTIQLTSNSIVFGKEDIPSIPSARVFIPVQGNYAFSVRAATNPQCSSISLLIDNQSIAFDPPSEYVPFNFTYMSSNPLSLTTGYHSISLHDKGICQVRVDKILIYSALTSSDASANYFSELGARMSGRYPISFHTNDPSSYTVQAQSSLPYFLVFSDAYSPLWEAGLGMQPIIHVVANSYANLFVIPANRDTKTELSYAAQPYKSAAIATSIFISLFVVAAWVFTIAKRLTKGRREHNGVERVGQDDPNVKCDQDRLKPAHL